MSSSQQMFGMENLESDELLSWFLLNQDLSDDFDINLAPSSADVEAFASSFFNESNVSSLGNSNTMSNNANNTNMNNYNNGSIVNNGNNINSTSSVTYENQSAIHKSSSMDSQSTSSKKKSKRESPNSLKKEAGLGKKRPRGEEDIESRVNELRAENADLQAHLLNVTQRTTEVQKQRTEMEKRMHAKLQEIGEKDDSDQSELAKLVKEYTDIYADYGKCRQREVHIQHTVYVLFALPSLAAAAGGVPRKPAREADCAHPDDQDVSVGAAAGPGVLPAQQVAHVRHAVQGAGDHLGAVGEDPGAEVSGRVVLLLLLLVCLYIAALLDMPLWLILLIFTGVCLIIVVCICIHSCVSLVQGEDQAAPEPAERESVPPRGLQDRHRAQTHLLRQCLRPRARRRHAQAGGAVPAVDHQERPVAEPVHP